MRVASHVDSLYFQSYEDLLIHEEMVADEVRVDAYKQALGLLSHDKIVVDVGTGTGLLAAFAADYGATYVYAIEASKIALRAQERFSEK